MSKVKTKLPPKVENMSKDELLTFLQKKRECENTAQKTVIELLENDVSEEKLLKCLPFINQCHYEDITEERAIIKICGYPICRKTLPDKLPTQQYKISCKTNRVFDITSRKFFCSNSCYKASSFLKDQLLTSPLWFRELEKIPQFKLMPLDTVGILGKEVDLRIVSKVDLEPNKNDDFKSFLDFTEASLTELSSDERRNGIMLDSVEVTENKPSVSEDKEDNQKNDETKNVNQRPNSLTENIIKSELSVDKKEKDTNKKPVKARTPKCKPSSKIVGDVIERQKENKVDPIISEGMKLVSSQVPAVQNVKKNLQKQLRPNKIIQPISITLAHLEKCIGEWFTIETMLFLFGEEHVKELVTDKGECIKEYLNNMANGLFYKSASYDQYQQLCRRLNILELEDRRCGNQVTFNKELKPLPHFSVLQEESKKLDIKVKAFFKGDMEIPNMEPDPAETEEDDNQDTPVPNLPLVDKVAQNALRRKIILSGFHKVLPDLIQSLGITVKEVNTHLRALVATFDLQAHNIVFKPLQWNLLAMIIIKLLSIKDLRLQKALETDKANRHMMLLLMSYEQDGGYLDRVVSWLTDIDRLMDKNYTQLTVNINN